MIYTSKQILTKVSYKVFKWLISTNYIVHLSHNKYTLKCILLENMDLDFIETKFNEYLKDKKEKMIEKCRQASKALWQNEDYRNKVTQSIKTSVNSEECKTKKSKSAKAFWTDERRKAHSIKIKQIMATDESKKLRSEISKQLWQNEDYRNRVTSHVTEALRIDLVKQKRAKSMRDVWSSESYKQKVSEKLKEVWLNEDYKQKMSEKFKKALNSSESKEKRSNIMKQVYEQYGDEILQKRSMTLKQNKSFNKSSCEDRTYDLLLTKFDKEDIERQYFDKERYPFKCDFYIKSLDLFIECHYGWHHANMPFDYSNKSHIEQLNNWKERAKLSKHYQNAIYQWTDLDIRKLQCAKKHNLNYKVFYNYNEFIIWCNKEV